MSEPKQSESPGQMSREEMTSALFAHMVMQQSNMAMMLLGKVPHPESGQTIQDLDAAKLFIDQLEMLETKTKGNVSKEEANLLKQSLMSLRMAFVEAVNAAQGEAGAKAEPPAPGEKKEAAESGSGTAAPPPAEESHKKFSKKY